MALDNLNASIPLQAGQPSGPFGPDLKQLITMQALAQKLQLGQQEVQGQNMLRQLYANPANIDAATGYPKPSAIPQVMRVSPSVGMSLLQDMATAGQRRAVGQINQSKLRQAHLEEGYQLAQQAITAYDGYLKNGLSEPAARARVQEEIYGPYREKLRTSGELGPSDLPPPNFEPMRSRQFIAGVQAAQAQPITPYQQAEVRQGEERLAQGQQHLTIEQQKASQAGEKGWQVLTDPTRKDEAGNPIQYRYNPNTAKATTLTGEPYTPGGAGKLGQATGGEAEIPPEVRKTMAEQYLAGDKTVMQNIGRGAQGAKNIALLRGEVARQAAEAGMSGRDIAAKMAEFAGLTAGERTLGTRTANIEMAVTEAQKLIPLALDASAKVDRSQFPTLNSLLLAAERGTGSEDVVRLGIATNSLINTYARAISPTGVPTVSDKDHARELLSAAWSKGQFAAGIDQLNKELEAARTSPGAVRKEFRGAVSQPPGSQAAPEPGAPTPTGDFARPGGSSGKKAGSLDVTEEEYNKLPRGAAYTVPGNPKVMYKQ